MNSKTTKPASFSIGKIITDNERVARDFDVYVDDLKKHVLICGGTGSGKTVTAATILKHLWSLGIPFLLVQPDKTEYRNLLLNEAPFKGDSAVFTVGNETVSPLMINPFEVLPGFPVSRHMEALRTIFNACFEMYAPMPQVLERALSHQYESKGWNLALNKNYRLPPGGELSDSKYVANLYPTIGDLYDCIEPLTNSFGYSDRIGPDVIAALQARIGSLKSANKNNVFNVKLSTDVGQIFSRPTLIELQDFFSVSEKAFFLSLLLLQLHEYRVTRPPEESLQHVLVIEDGHRLLNKQALASDDKGNTFAHIFADLLAQLGAYGQGVIICTQTPGQLVPELLANTGLKIVHRLVTATDLDSVSGSAYLSEAEKRHIAALPTSNAFVYGENMLHPHHLRIDSELKGMVSSMLPTHSDEAVRMAMAQLMPAALPAHYADLGLVDLAATPLIKEMGTMVANQRSFRLVFQRYVMSTQKNPTQLVHFRATLIAEVQRLLGGQCRNQSLPAITWCALVQATDTYFDRKGEVGYWTFDQVQEQKERFLEFVRPAIISSKDVVPGERKLSIKDLQSWIDNFTALQKLDQGPLPGCAYCKSKCFYRYEVSQVIDDTKIKFDFNSSINRVGKKPSESAAWFCWLLTERLIGKCDVNLAFCLAAHLVQDQQLSQDAQLLLLFKIRETLESIAVEGKEPPYAPDTSDDE